MGSRRWARAVVIGVSPHEWAVARQALEEHHAERVDVGGGGGGAALGLLRREVLRRAHHLARRGEREAVCGPGNAEVGDLDLAVGGDEKVGRLDVAVHDAGRVGGPDGVGGVGDQGAGHGGVQWCVRAQQVGQRLPVDELHDEERPRPATVVRLALTRVEDGGDTRVVQGGGVPGLGLEPGPERRVVGVLALEDLDRDHAVQDGVRAAPDHTHAAGGDPGVEAIAAGVVREDLRHRSGHGLITASIIALAMGAQRAPPAISLRPVLLDSTRTATAILGSSAGAKETNQA